MRLTVHGLLPNAAVRVRVRPRSASRSLCCSSLIRGGKRTDAAGRAVLRFRFPSSYLSCRRSCMRMRWRSGDEVEIEAMTVSGGAASAAGASFRVR